MNNNRKINFFNGLILEIISKLSNLRDKKSKIPSITQLTLGPYSKIILSIS